ncbi:hypothetical protein XOCgx_0443 [Xanthomonas oryzae pv. oryzicola]|nr:hypothetical protein XOCgx_0443 [Xanthomonas oryzae pv. oryzicola]
MGDVFDGGEQFAVPPWRVAAGEETASATYRTGAAD